MYDFIIVGGGIVGMSTAWQLKKQRPQARILVLEKEDSVGRHQTGRNSGVIHAGIYYEPASLKASFCHRGVEATMQFCRERDIPYQQCGKLLVATNDVELERMEALFQRCQQNDPTTSLLDKAQLRSREPAIKGEAAIFSPRTGIVDFRVVCQAMASQFVGDGGELRSGTKVTGIREQDSHITVSCKDETYDGRFLIACSGLMADRLARMQGIDIDFEVIPFRGEFYRIEPELAAGLNHLIYPIPDPALPFLGVHLTRRINGDVIVGPNAVLSFKREGYGKFEISREDLFAMFRFPGFWKVMQQNLRPGLRELRESWFKTAYIHRVQKYLPEIRTSDLLPFPPGIRAQPVTRDGKIIDDFLFATSDRSLHVCNAPSPAATSAIPIGEHISTQALRASAVG
jgi:L-2-hydroxyglutarate oxidase